MFGIDKTISRFPRLISSGVFGDPGISLAEVLALVGQLSCSRKCFPVAVRLWH